jgi:signal transduction histidine kinase
MRILHLEDSLLDHQLVCRHLEKVGLRCKVDRVETLAEFEAAVHGRCFDLILADYRLPGFTALDAWATLQNQRPPPPFILLSGTIGESAAVSAIHLGISDYLHKDDLTSLERVMWRAIEVRNALMSKEQADAELAASESRLAGFAEHLQLTIEQERASIAREIHDDIGGALAAAKLDLAWVARHTSDPTVHTHIQAASEMLGHAIGASQRIMMNLRPAILDQGLLAAVQWLLSGFEKRTGIMTSFRANNEYILTSKSVELAAYRTAQEALTNISKHASCSLVQVEISDAENVLTLDISDNGKGMASQSLQKPCSFGIKGLQERAKSVGGWLDVSSQEGIGTSIILSVPLVPPTNLLDESEQ